MLTVGALQKFCELLENKDAFVYITNDGEWVFETDENPILGKAQVISVYANRKYVHPETKIIAARPCKETAGCVEALMLYVKSDKE